MGTTNGYRWAWWQLRLRTLLLFVLVSGLLLGGVSYILSARRERQRTIEILSHLQRFDARFAEECIKDNRADNLPSDYRNDPFFQRWCQHFRRPYGKIDCAFVGVEGSDIADRDLALIRPWHRDSPITAINLSNTKISDAGVRHLMVHKSLTFLNLDQTQVTDRGLEALTTLTRLRLLSVRGIQITDEGAERLQKALPHCWVERDPLTTSE